MILLGTCYSQHLHPLVVSDPSLLLWFFGSTNRLENAASDFEFHVPLAPVVRNEK